MKQDRFLTGILVGIGALILLALGLFFTRQDRREYVAEDAPEGVVHNYVLAILNQDYQKAYGYLADLENKPSYDEFRRAFLNGMVNPGEAGVDVGTAVVNDDEAVVSLTVFYSYRDPFSSGYETTDRALLVNQDGQWKLSYMPYQLWSYNWYQETNTP
jgi:hypothetical protein